jgi:hypothetical protein
VKSTRVVTSIRPIAGSAAFVRAAVMPSLGTYAAAVHTACRFGLQPRDRNEGSLHPGEEAA